MRGLAGTNPAMATGGFTGRRGGGRGTGPAPAASPASTTGSGIGGQAATTVKMADGRSMTGILLAQSETLRRLARKRHVLLLCRKTDDVYRAKAIAPKADWTHYDGSLTGNRYSPLELINSTNVATPWRRLDVSDREQSARASDRRQSCRTASCTSPAGTRCTRSTRRPDVSSGATASLATRAF